MKEVRTSIPVTRDVFVYLEGYIDDTGHITISEVRDCEGYPDTLRSSEEFERAKEAIRLEAIEL